MAAETTFLADVPADVASRACDARDDVHAPRLADGPSASGPGQLDEPLGSTPADTPCAGCGTCPACLTCPVCLTTGLRAYARVPPRVYRQCTACEAISLAPGQRLDREAEAAYYHLHRNAPDDHGYRRFLSRLAAPLLQRLPAQAEGLDFGCGPGPALPEMLRAAGMRMAQFDPLFFPDRSLLARHYNFITCSEVVEHFHQPARSFALLFSLLRPGGLLAVMTGFPPQPERFATWHYHRDPTHVVFYTPTTFARIARRFDAECTIPCANVALLRRRG